jgi:hypothetical protein
MGTRQRSTATVTLVVTALALIAAVLAPQAEAASYRYWTFWTGGSGGWEFATRGADRVPADGTVDGWRFAVSDAAGSSARPGISSSFDQICANTAAVAGKKRVGLVIDYGSGRDAPPGERPPAATVARCLVLPPSANSYEALAKVTTLRVEQGLICGISGYPGAGCGEAVKDSPDGPTKPDNADNPGDADDAGNGRGGADSTTPSGNTKPPTPSPRRTDRQGSAGDTKATKKSSTNQPGRVESPTSEATTTPQPSEEVAAALSAELPATSSDRGSPVGLVVGVALLLCLAAAGVVAARRRR